MREGGQAFFLFDPFLASKEKKIRKTWEELEQCKHLNLTSFKTPSKFMVHL